MSLRGSKEGRCSEKLKNSCHLDSARAPHLRVWGVREDSEEREGSWKSDRDSREQSETLRTGENPIEQGEVLGNREGSWGAERDPHDLSEPCPLAKAVNWLRIKYLNLPKLPVEVTFRQLWSTENLIQTGPLGDPPQDVHKPWLANGLLTTRHWYQKRENSILCHTSSSSPF